MKTDLLVLAGTVLLLASVPLVSFAEGDDWAARSPLAYGELMGCCDSHHRDIVLAIEPAPPQAAEKIEAILATPDVVPVTAKTLPKSTTKAAPRHLSTAALLTFALIASPGTSLPQTNGSGRD